MNPPITDDADAEPRSWKAVGAQWLLNQGVSTVLLFAILGALWYGFPTLIQDIQTRHDAALQRVLDASQREHDQLITTLRELNGLKALERTGVRSGAARLIDPSNEPGG